MKYKIWDKKEPIITNTNEYFTAEEYIEKVAPADRVESMKFVVADSAVNGAFFNSFAGMKATYAACGVAFTDSMTDQDCLDAISAWEDEQQAKAVEASKMVTAEERIAAALEFQNLLSM